MLDWLILGSIEEITSEIDSQIKKYLLIFLILSKENFSLYNLGILFIDFILISKYERKPRIEIEYLFFEFDSISKFTFFKSCSSLVAGHEIGISSILNNYLNK